MNLWPFVTKQTPCPICGKTDWCSLGDSKAKCMRVESQHPCKSGGWFHDYNGKVVSLPPKRMQKVVENVAPFMERLHAGWLSFTQPAQITALASCLGVMGEALESLDTTWAAPNNAWAFPMRDDALRIIGIRLRSLGGAKWAVTGSRQGLFIPTHPKPSEPAYICEGPTSCAALLSLGLFAIGRGSCNTGGTLLRDYLRKVGIYRAVIIADNDRKVRPDGSAWNPGVEGAEKLGKELGIRYVVWVAIPKDVRDYIANGGTRAMIESDTKGMIWKK